MKASKENIKRISDAMKAHGIYSKADDTVISHAAIALGMVEQKNIDELEQQKAMTLFMKYAYQLGLTPVARRNLGLDVKKQEVKENPFSLKKVG